MLNMYFLLNLEINQFFIIDQNHHIYLNRDNLISAELHFGQKVNLAKVYLIQHLFQPIRLFAGAKEV